MVDMGLKIKRLRLEKEMTQQRLADCVGVTKSMVSAYESGIRSPSFEVLIQLAQVFHVSTDYLLGLRQGVGVDVSGLCERDVELVYRLVQRLRKADE